MIVDNLVTVITGTSKGIGHFLAGHYLERGHVVVGCSRKPFTLESAHYRHFEMDVSDERAVRALFASVRKEFGRLDHLINNAGIAAMNHAMLTPAETVNKVLATNVAGTFLFCREAAKLMQNRQSGRIVNFATVAVPLKVEGEAIYAASKAAVVSLTQILARELGSLGITVNAIGPTPIETDLIRSVPKEKIQRLLDQQAVRRMGTFADVANVIDFLLRPESDFVSGQVIYLGGV